jgi:molecular chaperone HtpG
MTSQPETFQFKSEAQQLLDLMIHSLYSNKQIFLRELISNSSDALDKLRFEALSDPSLLPEGEELGIRIRADAVARTLTISDNGVGMSREEIIENLGTIARSGTKEFAKKVAESKQANEKAAAEALIGQFGVGFYSTFMVADNVTVVSRRAGSDGATEWQSAGDGSFSIADASRDSSGTTVTLHLRAAEPDDDLPDFTQEWSIKEVIKKYSDFVTYPVQLEVTRTEKEKNEDGTEKEDGEETVTTDWETVNSMKAIWARRESEVTEDEYKEFYSHISHDWSPPFEHVAFRAEGAFEYDVLVFIPDTPPMDLFYRDQKYGLHLYVNRVLIKSEADELLQPWLRFLKGVVDSPDLSLNVSREILQQDRRVASIRKRIAKKTLDTLAYIQKEDADRYKKFWGNYGAVLKEGAADPDFKSQLEPLLLFASSNHESELTTLADYVSRMKDGQDAIYYVNGSSRAAVEQSPHLEAFKAKGYEVLFLVDPVDEFMMMHLQEFDGKKMQSVGKGDVELGTDEEKAAAAGERKKQQEEHADLLSKVQSSLDKDIKEVRLSSRLTDSPACLVSEQGELSPQLEAMLRAAGQAPPETKRILELNPSHPILAKMQAQFDANHDDPALTDSAEILLGQALLAEGSPLPDPAGFAAKIAKLLGT